MLKNKGAFHAPLWHFQSILSACGGRTGAMKRTQPRHERFPPSTIGNFRAIIGDHLPGGVIEKHFASRQAAEYADNVSLMVIMAIGLADTGLACFGTRDKEAQAEQSCHRPN
jgi:hypothetical protein